MAQASGFSSLLATSDDANYLCNYLCPSDDQSVEAVKYCVDCWQLLCQFCLLVHDKVNKKKDHKVVDSGQLEETLKNISVETCTTHNDTLEWFCTKHDALCCRVCAAENHSFCDINHLPTKAKGVRASDEFHELVKRLQSMKSDLEDIERKREADQRRLMKQVDAIKASFIEFRHNLMRHLDELETDSLKELKSKHKALDDKICQNIDGLQTSIQAVEAKLKVMTNDTKADDTHLFIHMKKGTELAKHESQCIDRMASAIGKEAIYFSFNPDMARIVYGFKSLGFVTYHPCQDVCIRKEEDNRSCWITAMCILSDGSTILADHYNKSLKRIDTSFNLIDSFNFPKRPYGVCTIGNGMVAVSFPIVSKVQIVSVCGNMKLTNSFDIMDMAHGEMAHGLASREGELYVSCSAIITDQGRVDVYTTSGQKLRTVQKSVSGDHLLTNPRQVAFSSDGSKMYVADKANGIITLDRQGLLVSTASHPKLNAVSVCLGKGGQVFSCGIDSNIIFRLSDDGTLEEFLDDLDGIRLPRTLQFDTSGNRLMVGMEDCDIVRVFDI